MSDSTAKNSAESTNSSGKLDEIIFKCKICGESKPLSDLVVIKHFYPQISACKVCARGVIDHQQAK
jgi:hypothetical protein